jgi:uncharacterized protein YuzE
MTAKVSGAEEDGSVEDLFYKTLDSFHPDEETRAASERVKERRAKSVGSASLTMEVDHRARCAYISLSKEQTAYTKEVSDSVQIDLDEHGRLVGVEMLYLPNVPIEAPLWRRIAAQRKQIKELLRLVEDANLRRTAVAKSRDTYKKAFNKARGHADDFSATTKKYETALQDIMKVSDPHISLGWLIARDALEGES